MDGKKAIGRDGPAGRLKTAYSRREDGMLVEVNAMKTNYELSGGKNRPVVMLSHSLGSSLVMWQPQMKSLQDRFAVLRYDIRGHGGSQATGGTYSLDLMAQDAIGLLDVLRISRVHFVGLSLGGMIGLRLALNHPDRLQSLVLCDTSSRVSQEGAFNIQERIDTARKGGMEALADSRLERWFTPSFIRRNPPEVELLRKVFLATPVEGYVKCSQALLDFNDSHLLPRIKIPTLLIVGEEDPATPFTDSKTLQEGIPGAELVIIPAARHFSNVEQPEVFNKALLDFLEKRPKIGGRDE
jgi:3-oxoadipate enol-lactonase